MRLLFIHQNLPGQYRHLLLYYSRQPGCQVVGVGELKHLRANIQRSVPGVQLVGYEMPSATTALGVPALQTTEAAVNRGQAVLRALLQLKKKGFYPDVVYAHPGWGETLFLKDVFPRARLIHFCEFYYNTNGQDFNFDPEFPSSVDDLLRLRVRNFHHLMALEQADLGVAPTTWQKTRFPTSYQPKIEVIHDGIDTAAVAPNAAAHVEISNKGIRLTRENEVITFVSRNLEPYRGFHTFMRSIPKILRTRPKAHVIVVGGNDVSYGRRLANGSYKDKYLSEIADAGFDSSRVHFVGKVPYVTLLRLFQVSTAHIYLTYPFVLSWSMMEAMAAGCPVIGSRTPPVEEVIRHDENGLLVDFFSIDELVDAVNQICGAPEKRRELGQAARNTIKESYDLEAVCLPRQRALIEAVA